MSKKLSFHDQLVVRPGTKVKLHEWNPEETFGFSKDDEKTHSTLAKLLRHLDDLQNLLYASKKYALLIVLQGVDSAGKDGTIRHVMSGVSPQGCRVTSFKTPTEEELLHDFLWRIHKAVPERGEIGIFNRSHYEDVLAVRVHKLLHKSVWSKRYKEINRFERQISNDNVKVLKFFLHISREEQLKRLDERLHDKKKEWKLSSADFREREYWPQYVSAYEDALSYCSTPWAPWFIIPSNHKWLRNIAVSHIIVKTLEDMNMKFPKATIKINKRTGLPVKG